jgi:hypothetical protein
MAYLLPIDFRRELVRHRETSEEDEGSGGKLVILEWPIQQVSKREVAIRFGCS